MSRIAKQIEGMRNNPKAVRFDDVDKVLCRFGFVADHDGTSHVVYRKPGKLLSVPKPHGGAKHVKPGYVYMALDLLEGETIDGI